MFTRIPIVAALVACSGPTAPSPVPSPAPPSARAGDAAQFDALDALDAVVGVAADARQWFAGDVHMHVAPPDEPADVQMSSAQIAEAAQRAHMDFVVLTPHLSRGRWASRRRSFQTAWRALAERARAEQRVTLIPGVEFNNGAGHFTIAGFDLGSTGDGDLLALARAAGAFISVNHPFAVPTNIPGLSVSDSDMSYRVWSHGERGFEDLDAAEVWNVPLSLANVISRPGGRTGEARAWSAANRFVHEKHRRIGAVGGTDNHAQTVIATTWVLAVDRSADAILEALRAGATCVGGPDAGSFRAHGDGDLPDAWVRVGGTVHAPNRVTLAWDGSARVFVDDVDQGEYDRQLVLDTGGEVHTYRIEIGPSRCSFIYANL